MTNHDALINAVRNRLRLKHYSRRTEDAYVHWIARYRLFHGDHNPAALGADHVTAFLNYLAVERNVAASTQNQALSCR